MSQKICQLKYRRMSCTSACQVWNLPSRRFDQVVAMICNKKLLGSNSSTCLQRWSLGSKWCSISSYDPLSCHSECTKRTEGENFQGFFCTVLLWFQNGSTLRNPIRIPRSGHWSRPFSRGNQLHRKRIGAVELDWGWQRASEKATRSRKSLRVASMCRQSRSMAIWMAHLKYKQPCCRYWWP